MSQEAEQQFDMITALLGAGVPHIVEQILQSLDVKSLVMSEQVSSTWRDVIEDLHIWKHMIKHRIDSNPLWKALFKRRGWHEYLNMPPAEPISRRFYWQLHHTAFRDIQSLEANWRRGHYTLTRVDTGSGVWCLQFDDNKIVTGHKDGTMKIWDRGSLQLLKVLEGYRTGVHCLQYNEDMIISDSVHYTVKVWDIQTGQLIEDLFHHSDMVTSLKFTTDTLVTGSDVGAVAAWNIKSPTDIRLRWMIRHAHPESPVSAVNLSKTNVFSGAGDNTVKVWNKSTGELVRTLNGHGDFVSCLQLHGSHLISSSYDKTIRVWKIDTGECIRVLHGHDDSVMDIVVDNKRIVSGSFDETIKIWDLAAALDAGSASDAICITTLKDHTSWVQTLQFDDFQVISGSQEGTLLIHDFLDPTPPILRT